jgi:hypothetical protein
MSADRLTPLQRRILRSLSVVSPPATLTGGGALVGFHIGHRETRDLDLFWRNRRELGDLVGAVEAALRESGLQEEVLRRAPAFAELRVSDGEAVCVVDLVAEPFGPIHPPEEVHLENSTVLVDGAHEIMASKLATLLERSELRDLVDLQALLNAGGDLSAAVRDAPLKDAGFSPLTLAWVLKGFEVAAAGRALGWTAAEIENLAAFRDWLVDWLTEASAPRA